ncbi:MAG: hypothetical protein KKC53_04410 [Actinobacteria bacterium]|nr:hypothetical protein [Actinomycetota bacterium]
MDPERDKAFVEEAFKIIEKGKEKGIIFRLLGSIAVKNHSPKYRYLYDEMKRPLTDIDLMTYGKFREGMKKFFKDLGYEPISPIFFALYGKKRQIYWSDEKKWQVDIFFDELDMCHKVDFRNRLELDDPTITLTDILLEKMQIVEINPKDIKDTSIMLLEHDVGDKEEETINMNYISKLLAKDWGYYYTVTTNLKKVKNFLGEFESLTDENSKIVTDRIDKILERIEDEPKSLKWKIRSKVGTKKKWYKEVEEVGRG